MIEWPLAPKDQIGWLEQLLSLRGDQRFIAPARAEGNTQINLRMRGIALGKYCIRDERVTNNPGPERGQRAHSCALVRAKCRFLS